MRKPLALSFLFLLLAVLLVGCRGESRPQPVLAVQADPDTHEELILYSLFPADFPPRMEPKGAKFVGEFHSHKVFGQLPLTDLGPRKEIMRAFQEGQERSGEDMPKCFFPRHGLRVVKVGQSTDFVICFQCKQFEVYTGEKREVKSITRDPAAVFNRYLKEAGITVAAD